MIGHDVLVGDLCALAASLIFAIYCLYCKRIINGDKCPMSIYFSTLSVCVIVISNIMAKVAGEDIYLFSTQEDVGLFGFLSST